jgi:hypothetical protein
LGADPRWVQVLARRWADEAPGVWPSIVLRTTIMCTHHMMKPHRAFHLVASSYMLFISNFFLISILNFFYDVVWRCGEMRFGRHHAPFSFASFRA